MLSNSARHCVDMYPPQRTLNPMSLSVFVGSVEMLTAHTVSNWRVGTCTSGQSTQSRFFLLTYQPALMMPQPGGSRHLYLASQLGCLSNGLHTGHGAAWRNAVALVPGWPGSQPPSGKGDSSSAFPSLHPPEPHPASLCPHQPAKRF